MVRDNNFGDRNLPALNPSTNNQLSTRGSSEMISKDLGTIMIKTFEEVSEAFENKDVPVNAEQIEKAVTKAINKSKLAKGGGTSSGGGASGNSDKYIDYLKEKDAKKEAERKQKEEEQDRQKRNKEIEENVEKVFKGLNEFSHNPLKGFSDLIDKGIKKAFTVFNTPIEDWDVWHKNNKKSSSKSETSSESFSEESEVVEEVTDLSQLIQDKWSESESDEEENQSNIETTSDNSSEILDMMSDLIQDNQEQEQQDSEEHKQERKQDKKENAEVVENEEKHNIIASQSLASLAGKAILIVAGIAVVATAIAALSGLVLDFFMDIPNKIVELGSNISSTFKDGIENISDILSTQFNVGNRVGNRKALKNNLKSIYGSDGSVDEDFVSNLSDDEFNDLIKHFRANKDDSTVGELRGIRQKNRKETNAQNAIYERLDKLQQNGASDYQLEMNIRKGRISEDDPRTIALRQKNWGEDSWAERKSRASANVREQIQNTSVTLKNNIVGGPSPTSAIAAR